MKPYSVRNNARRLVDDRRSHDRRKIRHAFNSVEWLDYIQNHYLAWPKHDRRCQERRSEDRRASERRQTESYIPHLKRVNRHEVLLTVEERQFIEFLNYSEDDLSNLQYDKNSDRYVG